MNPAPRPDRRGRARRANDRWRRNRFGPDDRWPRHDKPFWNTALAAAKAAGWSLTYLNAPHRFGVLKCPAGEHTAFVDKTATGGETKSKELIKDVRNCRHGTGVPKSEARVAACERYLARAEELLSQVERGLADAETARVAAERFERLADTLADADDTLREAYE